MNDLSVNLNFYRPSGAVSFFGVACTLLLGLIAGIPSACLYAFVSYHNPIVYLNVVFALLLGSVLGWLVSAGIRRFAVRNVPVAAAVSLVAVVGAWLAHWVFYGATVLADIDGMGWDFIHIALIGRDFLMEPGIFLSFIRAVNAEGVWTLESRSGSGIEIKGLLLSGIWLCEAAVIFWGALKSPWLEAGKPFSERSENWLKATPLPLAVAFVEDKSAFFTALSRGDWRALTSPLPESDAPKQYATVTLYADAFEPCVTVTNTSVKKKSGISTEEVARYLQVTPFVADSIQKALGGVFQA